MSDILNYTPGQIITFYEEVKDINGQRTDDGYVPAITRVLLPRFVVAAGYPQAMTRIDVGLYYFQLTLPKGAPAIGTYFVDITYKDPNTLLLVNDSRQIVVTAPYGNYSATVPDGYGGDGYGIGYGVAGGDLFGHYPSPIVAGLQGNHIASTPPSSGQVLRWNGTAWAPTTLSSSSPPDGYATGDLAGSYPNPIVAKLRGHTVAAANPTDGQVLTWDNADGYWRPETPSGGGSSGTPYVFVVRPGVTPDGTFYPTFAEAYAARTAARLINNSQAIIQIDSSEAAVNSGDGNFDLTDTILKGRYNASDVLTFGNDSGVANVTITGLTEIVDLQVLFNNSDPVFSGQRIAMRLTNSSINPQNGTVFLVDGSADENIFFEMYNSSIYGSSTVYCFNFAIFEASLFDNSSLNHDVITNDGGGISITVDFSSTVYLQPNITTEAGGFIVTSIDMSPTNTFIVYSDIVSHLKANEFKSFSDLYTSLNDNDITFGTILIQGTVTVEAGNYNLSGFVIKGLKGPAADTIRFADNAFIFGDTFSAQNITVSDSGSSTIPLTLSSSYHLNFNNVFLSWSSSTPLVSIQNANLVIDAVNSFFQNGSGAGNEAFELNNSNFFINITGVFRDSSAGTSFSDNLFRGSGQLIYAVDSGAGFSSTQPGFSGTITPNLIDKAVNVSYTPTVSGNWSPIPTQVAGALDQLAQLVVLAAPPTLCYAYVSSPILEFYVDGGTDHITFDAQSTVGSTVSLDTSSSYSISAGSASIGRFTLSGGHSYKLEGSLNAQFDGIIQYQWWDATNGVAIPGASVAGNAGGAAPLSAVAFIPSSYIMGPGILVELRLTYVQSNTYVGQNTSGGFALPWAIIESIG